MTPEQLKEQEKLVKQKNKEVKEDYDEAINIGFFGTIGFICTIIAPMIMSNYAWMKPYIWTSFFLGVTLLLVYIAISFEKNKFFLTIWKYGAVKFSVSVGIAILIYYASFTASSDINRIFGTDASAFPYTHAAVTFINVFITIEPIFRFLFILSGISLVLKFMEYKSTGHFGYLGVLFIFGCFASGGYGWYLNSSYFSEQKDIDLRIYKIAHKVDFSSNYPCKDLKNPSKVIFLGPKMDYVLLDKISDVNPEESLKHFMLTNYVDSKFKIPSTFKVKECNQT